MVNWGTESGWSRCLLVRALAWVLRMERLVAYCSADFLFFFEGSGGLLYDGGRFGFGVGGAG